MSINFMAFDFKHAAVPGAADAPDRDYDDVGPHACIGERVVTAIAVTLEVFFVSTVAVLMGMAWRAMR